MPSQLLALQLLDHLAVRRRAHLATTVNQAIVWLHAEVPDWKVTAPAGGSVLWPALPLPDTGPYVHLARRHGVHVTPGRTATPTRDQSSRLRICVDRPSALVEEGIRRLGQAWNDLQTSQQPALG